MKNLLLAGICLLSVISLSADDFEKNYGRGVIHMEVDSVSQIDFYSSPGSAISHTLFFTGGAWAVDAYIAGMDSNYFVPEWFKTLFLMKSAEYSRVDIIGLDSSNGYYRTDLRDENNQEVWVKKTSNVQFLSWFGFYSTMASIEMENDTIVLFNTPSATSPRVDYTSLYGKDVRIDQLHRVQGNWMEVDIILPAVGPVPGPPTRVKGWILWRNDKKPLVQYNLMGC